MNSLKRVIVAIIFIPALLWLYYTGGLYLMWFLGIVSALCTFELIKMNRQNSFDFTEVILTICLFYFIVTDNLLKGFLIIFLTMICHGAINVFLNGIEGATNRISINLFYIIYPALGFGLLYRLSDFHVTLIPVLAVLIWLTDTFAYFVGMSVGKHRGFFKCSPKKSIEGFIGGFVFAYAGSIVVMWLYPQVYSFKHIILLTVSAGLFGQFGDLFESIIKRDMGVKDSSNIIPGHGGVLDRFDSLLIAAPVMYYGLMVIS